MIYMKIQMGKSNRESPRKRKRGERISHPAELKGQIVRTLLEASPEGGITQVKLIDMLKTSQMTAIRYVSELKGEGVLSEERFGTSTMYSIASLDTAKERGYLREVVSEEYEGLRVRVFAMNSKFVVQFRVPPVIDMNIPMSGEDMSEAIGSLEGVLAELSTRLERVKKVVKEEFRGSE